MSNRVIVTLCLAIAFVLGILAGAGIREVLHEHNTAVTTDIGAHREDVFSASRQAWSEYPEDRKQRVCDLYYSDMDTIKEIMLDANDGDMVASVWNLEVQDELCQDYKE